MRTNTLYLLSVFVTLMNNQHDTFNLKNSQTLVEVIWVSKLQRGATTLTAAVFCNQNMKHIGQWGGTCCRLVRKESVGIGVCIKLPLLSQVGRAQEREGAK